MVRSMLESKEVLPRLKEFFEFMAERQRIWKRRQKGLPFPWTKDPVLRTTYFTNIYRELDKGTIYWFRTIYKLWNPEINDKGFTRSERCRETLFKTIIYRLVNRVETFKKIDFPDSTVLQLEGGTSVNKWLEDFESLPDPKFTGAHIVCMGSRPKVVSRPVVGWEDYARVTNTGKVIVLERRVKRVRNGKPYYRTEPRRIILGQRHYRKADNQNHLSVRLSYKGYSEIRMVHSLVLEAFVGPCPEGMEACHNDGNPLNNKLENLRWGTRSSNQKDIKKHDPTWRVGERNGQSKLTNEKVDWAKKQRLKGKSYVEIARKLKVTPECVSMAVRGVSWKSPPNPTIAKVDLPGVCNSLSKAEGLKLAVKQLDSGLKRLWNDISSRSSLEEVWNDLKRIRGVGGFISYEICCDLIYAGVIPFSINEWCNPGPGCLQGINYLVNGHRLDGDGITKDDYLHICLYIRKWQRRLMKKSGWGCFTKFPYWTGKEVPGVHLAGQQTQKTEFPWQLSLRSIEHSLCEFQKYVRVKHEGGRGKNVYRPTGKGVNDV